MFAQLKNNWGWKKTWQQTRQVLHRWTQILSAGYAIPQLLALKGCVQVSALTDLTPWRSKKVAIRCTIVYKNQDKAKFRAT